MISIAKIVGFNSLPQGSFRFHKFWEPISQTPSKTRLCLDTDLHSLERAKSNISNNLRRSGTSKVDQGLVLARILWASNIRVILLKELVESEFASTLGTVTKQGRHPTTEKALEALLLEQNTKPRRDVLILSRVDLKSTSKHDLGSVSSKVYKDNKHQQLMRNLTLDIPTHP